jgi:hypothetical protein
LPASQLPIHSMPAAHSRPDELQQLEAVLLLHLRNIELQQAENEADRACIAQELGARSERLSEERTRELEESLALLVACEHELLCGRSVLAHWLQQSRAEAAAGGPLLAGVELA